VQELSNIRTEVDGGNLLPLTLNLEQKFANLSHCSLAAFAHGAKVTIGSNVRSAVRNCHCQSHPSENGYIYQIITHVGYTLVIKPPLLQNLLVVSQLVLALLHHKSNPEITCALINHLRSPACEQGHLYPSPLEQTNAMAVADIKNLTFLAIGMPNKAAVSEYPVDIQNQQFDLPCPFSNLVLTRQKLHLQISY
jgi:hypothetical protein